MITRKSKVFKGVCYLKRNVVQDMKGTRLLNYSWLTFLNMDITDVYKNICRKEIAQAYELHGLFYYPEQSFLIRCLKGGAQFLAVDLRSESISFLKCERVPLAVNGENQVYLPAGFAWGILSEEKNTVIQLHTTNNGRKEVFLVEPFDDQFDFSWGSEEFSVAKYDLPVKSTKAFKEYLSE